MVCAGVISPGSKLACARGLRPATASTTLGEVCSVSWADEDDLYSAMEWLLGRQGPLEDGLAARHLRDGVLVLYDVSSAAFEGRTCPLGKIGYPRDGVHASTSASKSTAWVSSSPGVGFRPAFSVSSWKTPSPIFR